VVAVGDAVVVAAAGFVVLGEVLDAELLHDTASIADRGGERDGSNHPVLDHPGRAYRPIPRRFCTP